MTHRYFAQLAYNGTNYCGWQIQPNAPSVQEELTRVLSIQLKETVSITGAGRTDTGVHASFFTAHFETNQQIENLQQLCYKTNSMLPYAIQLKQIFEVPADMHARFNALSRTYHYYISNQKDPFRHDFAAFVPHHLNTSRMNEAASKLLDYIDFTSFSKLHTDVKTNNCKIEKACWTQVNDLLVFEIRADRFLRNMVRAIVGTLINVGREKITVNEFCHIIESKNRSKAGASALAKGLFLTDIVYPEPVNSQLIRTNTSVL